MKQVIGWGVETPAVLLQCSMNRGPKDRCTEKAVYGVVEELREEPSNYRLWAFCAEHLAMWTRSQQPPVEYEPFEYVGERGTAEYYAAAIAWHATHCAVCSARLVDEHCPNEAAHDAEMVE